MSEYIDNLSSNARGSEKSFGIVFSIVFLIIALYPLLNSQDIRIWAIIISAIFILLGLIRPKTLLLPNKLWFRLGLLLGAIISPIIMVLVYFITVLPTGLIMHLLGRDLLKLKLDKKINSYWIIRDEPLGSMKNQF